MTFIQNQIRSVSFSKVVLLLVLLYSHISFGLTSILTGISPRIFSFLCLTRASLVAQRLKGLPAMWETWVRSLGREDPPEKEMATHSSILAWRIPWAEEPGGLPSTGSQRVGHDWATSFFFLCLTNVTIQQIARSLSRHTAQRRSSLPWGLSLLPRGVSLLRLSARRLSPCCSRCLPRTGSSRGPLRPETGLKAEQSLPCEGMHYSDSLHFHFQQTEGRFLFLTHWRGQIHRWSVNTVTLTQFNY